MTENSPFYKEYWSYHKDIMKFDSDFIPMTYGKGPKEEGMYITIRCGLGGIYQTLNTWKNGGWEAQALDGSFTIAYSKEKVQLKISPE